MRPIALKSIITIVHAITKGYDLDSFINPAITEKKRIPKTYFSQVIQKRAGITAAQIRHWTVSGVLEPYKLASGTGKMHVYDHQNLIEAKICKELNYYSINYNYMKSIMNFLRTHKWKVNWIIRDFSRSVDESKKEVTMSNNIVIWDFFKKYPLHEDIYIMIWKTKTAPAIMTDQNFGDLSLHVTNKFEIVEISERCSSVIVINLTNLIWEEGDFFKEW
ncbi:MAG TPA: hypothetical protein PKW17_10255 [Smithellaceae bacterium]|nr:hypothetical protein [Smithellaceae bacterium]